MFLWKLNIEELMIRLADEENERTKLCLQKDLPTRECLVVIYQFFSREAEQLLHRLTIKNCEQTKQKLIELDAKLATILLYLLYFGEITDFNKIYAEIQDHSLVIYQQLQQEKLTEFIFQPWLFIHQEQQERLTKFI